MRKLIIVLSVFVMFHRVTIAQTGVDSATYDAVTNAIIVEFGSGAIVQDIVNVDTAVGRYDICDGLIENEHGLLTHAYVFAGEINYEVGMRPAITPKSSPQRCWPRL